MRKASCRRTTNVALALMGEYPSLIKRPVLEYADTLLVGFTAERYASVLA